MNLLWIDFLKVVNLFIFFRLIECCLWSFTSLMLYKVFDFSNNNLFINFFFFIRVNHSSFRDFGLDDLVLIFLVILIIFFFLSFLIKFLSEFFYFSIVFTLFLLLLLVILLVLLIILFLLLLLILLLFLFLILIIFLILISLINFFIMHIP